MMAYGLEMLEQLQAWRSPVVERWATEISSYGEGFWIISIIGLLFWVCGARWAYRVALSVMAADLLTGLVKNLACIPRPWVLDPALMPPADAQWGAFGFSFPSGHVSNSAALVFGIAGVARRGWAWGLAAVWAVLMGLSRMVLGVHTPLDVGGGLLLAVVCVFGMGRLYDRTKDSSLRMWWLVTAAWAVALAVWAILQLRPVPPDAPHFAQDAYRSVWATIALFASWAVERTWIRFDPSRLGGYRWLAAVLGVLGLSLIIGNLRALLAPWLGAELAGYVLAAANSLWVFVVWPILLKPLYRPAVG